MQEFFFFPPIRFVAVVRQPLQNGPDFKHPPPRQSARSSNQNLRLNVGPATPITGGRGDGRERGVSERRGGADGAAEKTEI